MINMSMEDLEPLSPSDAARILAGQRWNRDEASGNAEPAPADGEYYGKEAVERGQGYEPMRSANPIKQPDTEPIESSAISEALRRDQEAPQEIAAPTPINYLEQGGEKGGQPMPDNQTVSAEQAAQDLSRWRDSVGEQIEAAETQQIRDAIDQLRAGDQQQPQVPAEPVALDKQIPAAPEAQAQPVAEDPVAKALADPAVLNAVQTEVQRHTAAAEQARVNYESAMAQNAAAAAYSLIASFPELQGVRPDQIPTAIAVVQKQNPQRADQMVRHIDQVGRLVEQHQKAQAAQVQAYQEAAHQQFQRAATDADANYNDWAKEHLSADQSSEIREEALAMLKDYGLSEKDVAWHWQNNSLFRSFPAQRLMADAARWRLSQKALKSKAVPPPVPQVVRPGSPTERASASEYEYRALNEKLNRSTRQSDQLRAAAELVAARRARRG
jgi:hypothetical protein